ncbi:ribonuclease E inhibitor RraB [Shewanella sp. TC10]|uniref:ribonuclease E inhibitor RraB n=1 Tax=Shewanella sp. TC10 TaxID=1419739 RepID=UPI00129E2922|nr:ribonuclease E inhibitor RraB [Shewanella sp. TC10]
MRSIYLVIFLVLSFTAQGKEMQYPNDENGQVLQSMLERGVNLNRVYEIDFFHLFKDEESAVKMAYEVDHSNDNIKVAIYTNEVSKGFDVYVSVNMEPTHENITHVETTFAEVAIKTAGKAMVRALKANITSNSKGRKTLGLRSIVANFSQVSYAH